MGGFTDVREKRRVVSPKNALTITITITITKKTALCRVVETTSWPKLNGRSYKGEDLLVFLESATHLIGEIPMKILNLTQHLATPEQNKVGVCDCSEENRKELGRLLTFNEIPSHKEMQKRAESIADIVVREQAALEEGTYDSVMLGGAPFFMSSLEEQLAAFNPVYAFSHRVSVETLVDGVVMKQNEFRHLGFVAARTSW